MSQQPPMYSDKQVRAARKLARPVWRSRDIDKLFRLSSQQHDLFIQEQERSDREGESPGIRRQLLKNSDMANRILPEELQQDFAAFPVNPFSENQPMDRALDKFAVKKVADRWGVQVAKPFAQYLGLTESPYVQEYLARLEAFPPAGNRTQRVKASRGKKSYLRKKAVRRK